MIANKTVEIFKPVIDTRYHAEKIVSHDASALDAKPISDAKMMLEGIDASRAAGGKAIDADPAQFEAAFAARLETLAASRPDATRLIAKLGKLRTPPVGVAVISRTTAGDIPAWEQILSAGAVCTNLTYAALAMGYGANWITDWYAYDAEARAVLGLADNEQVAGFVFMGTAAEAPQERVRPDVAALTTRFEG